MHLYMYYKYKKAKNIKYCKLNLPKLLQDILYFLFSIMSIGQN